MGPIFNQTLIYLVVAGCTLALGEAEAASRIEKLIDQKHVGCFQAYQEADQGMSVAMEELAAALSAAEGREDVVLIHDLRKRVSGYRRDYFVALECLEFLEELKGQKVTSFLALTQIIDALQFEIIEANENLNRLLTENKSVSIRDRLRAVVLTRKRQLYLNLMQSREKGEPIH